jgi:alpha-glucosidase
VSSDYGTYNVAVERDDPTSMLSLFRRLLELRRATSALTTGSLRTLDAGSADILAYLRESPDQRVLVVLNASSAPQVIDLSHAVGTTGTVLCSTQMDRDGSVGLADLHLRPDEGIIIEVAARR